MAIYVRALFYYKGTWDAYGYYNGENLSTPNFPMNYLLKFLFFLAKTGTVIRIYCFSKEGQGRC